MTNDRNALYYKQCSDEKNMVVVVNLSSAKAGVISHRLENDTLIDFKVIESTLIYMMATDDNYYKLHIRSLKKDQPSYEMYNLFPRRYI